MRTHNNRKIKANDKVRVKEKVRAGVKAVRVLQAEKDEDRPPKEVRKAGHAGTHKQKSAILIGEVNVMSKNVMDMDTK